MTLEDKLSGNIIPVRNELLIAEADVQPLHLFLPDGTKIYVPSEEITVEEVPKIRSKLGPLQKAAAVVTAIGYLASEVLQFHDVTG